MKHLLLVISLTLWPLLVLAEDAAREDPLDGLPDASPLSWKAGVSKAELKLAERFVVSVEITHPKGEVYELRPNLDFEPFGVVEQKLETSDTDPAVSTLRLTLQPFKTGKVEVPRLRFLVQGANGAQKHDVPPQSVSVQGVIDPSQGAPQMREDLRPLPTRHEMRWWPLLLLLGLVLVAGLVYWLRKRALRPAAPPPPTPREPADIEALVRLTALERQELIVSNRHQEYYFRLTEIVRDYLGRRYGFDALELTTDELLDTLKVRPTPQLAFDPLARFLRDCDLVKFARVEPTSGEAKAAMDEARTLVEKTRPPPPVEQQGRAS